MVVRLLRPALQAFAMKKLIFRSSDIGMFVMLALYLVVDFPTADLAGQFATLPAIQSALAMLAAIPAPTRGFQVLLMATLLTTSLFGHLSQPRQD